MLKISSLYDDDDGKHFFFIIIRSLFIIRSKNLFASERKCNGDDLKKNNNFVSFHDEVLINKYGAFGNDWMMAYVSRGESNKFTLKI